MKLYLVRHSKPLIEDGICYGSSDIPLLENEHLQMQQRLAEILPKEIPIYSSPLQRSAQLASAVARKLGSADPVFDPRLAEMNFGSWERRSWEDIAREEIDAWAHDLALYRPGGGENVLEVAQRIAAFYDDLVCTPIQETAVICHAGTIRLLLARNLGLSPLGMALHAASVEHKIAYGEVLVVDI